MSNVFDFAAAKKLQPQQSTLDLQLNLKSDHEVFVEVYEDVMGGWQQAAAKNRMNEFVEAQFPPSLTSKKADALSNLTVLSAVEQRYGMQISVNGPGMMSETQNGWVAAFKSQDKMFSTPEVVTEGIARALLIVLFVHFKAVMKSLGREI